MAGQREKLEDIVSRLRQIEVPQGQGMMITVAAGQILQQRLPPPPPRQSKEVQNGLSGASIAIG